MSRGRGGGYSSRGTFRGGSSRGPRGGYRGSHNSHSTREHSSHSFPSPSFDSRPKFNPSDRFSSRNSGRGSSKFDDYRRPPFRSSSHSRERSPDRKKMRLEGFSSRHDNSYGSSSGRYESSTPYNERPRNSFSSSSHTHMASPPSRKHEEFRRPTSSTPYSSSRGSFNSSRGRGNSRGSRILRARERLPPPSRGSRRLIDNSYAIRKNIIASRSNDFNRRLKISKLRSAIAARRRSPKVESDSEKDHEIEKKPSSTSVKEEVVDEKMEEAAEKSNTSVADVEVKRTSKKPLIKLVCPHCNVRCITFRKYEIHLSSRTHMISMKKVALKQKAIISQMRQAQRSAQNELEKASNEDLAVRTNFCPICKLNYKQKKSVHQSSDAHKNMKKFLMPFCKVCSVTFKSPMMFESHCCSIEHIKRKQRMENEASSEESNDCADLENFTTIDSVGDVDESDESNPVVKKEENVEIVNVGIEKVKKVEAYYCELCKLFLPKTEESEMSKILAKHCKLLVHMKRYIRYKEDKDLEEKAQMLQKKEIEEKEALKIKSESEKDESGKVETEHELDESKEDKMWDDVSKDLGDILADAEDDDEEEEMDDKTKERYDRFKLSEKNGEESLTEDIKEDDETVEASTENGSVAENETDKT